MGRLGALTATRNQVDQQLWPVVPRRANAPIDGSGAQQTVRRATPSAVAVAGWTRATGALDGGGAVACSGGSRRVELITGVEAASSRPVRRIVLREG